MEDYFLLPIQVVSTRIALLDSAIYDEGVKLHGHVPIKSAQSHSTKQNRIIKLVALKNSLQDQLRAPKSDTDLEGLEVFLTDAKNKLPLAKIDEKMSKALLTMTQKSFGCIGVINKKKQIIERIRKLSLSNLEKDTRQIDKNNINIKELESIYFDVSLERPEDPNLDKEIYERFYVDHIIQNFVQFSKVWNVLYH